MAAVRRLAEREHDLAELARLYLARTPQEEIAEQIGVSRQTISRDLRTLQKRWVARSDIDFDAARAEELARVDHLERVYWVAWERSLTERQISQSATKRSDKGANEDRAGIRREQRLGDPRYLEGVRWCIERRCRLLGLDAPMRLEHSGELGAVVVDRVVAEIPAGLSGDDHSQF